jgi:hypothetical protein
MRHWLSDIRCWFGFHTLVWVGDDFRCPGYVRTYRCTRCFEDFYERID